MKDGGVVLCSFEEKGSELGVDALVESQKSPVRPFEEKACSVTL